MANSAQFRNEIAAGKWDDKLRAKHGGRVSATIT